MGPTNNACCACCWAMTASVGRNLAGNGYLVVAVEVAHKLKVLVFAVELVEIQTPAERCQPVVVAQK